MGDVIEFKPKPERNLYYVDDYYVILASSASQALAYAQEREETDDEFEVELVDDQLELSVIKSGKVEIMLWKREPNSLERLVHKITVRSFIDQFLERFSLPSSVDIIEDRGAQKPKR